MLARGWTPSERTRTVFTVGLGLLLVFNPVYLVPLGVGGPAYSYEAVPVEMQGSSFSLEPDGALTVGPIDGLDCHMFDGGRRCYFDQLLYEQGNQTVSERFHGDYAGSEDEYVVVDLKVYRRTHERVNDSAYTFGLVRVPAETALRDVSVPVEQAPAPIRTAVRTGDARTHTEFENQFVRANGDYYLFTKQGESDATSGRWFLHAVGIAAGLGLLRRRFASSTDQ